MRNSIKFFSFLLITLFVLIGWQNSILTSAYDEHQQVTEIAKETLPPGQVPQLVLNSQKLSKIKNSQRLNLTISFKSQQEKEVRRLITELYDPTSPNYHKWISPEDFGRRFGLSETEFNFALDWLANQGFTIEQAWPNRLAISFSASAEQVERAFKLEVNQYQDSSQRIFYANDRLPKLPERLSKITSNIHGLNNAYLYQTYSQFKPFPEEQQKQIQSFIKQGKNIDTNAQSGTSPIFFGPDDFNLAYNINPVKQAGLRGQGQRVGIIINSNVLDTDINLHRQLFDLPRTLVKRFVPPGLEMAPVRFQGEAELDIDSISLIAPMADIELILIPELSTANVFLAEQFIVNTLKTPIVNESFGGCEANVFDPAEQMLMLQGVAQGIAFFIAAGDEGAECFPGGTAGQSAINCPACYDGATAVGGTQIVGEYDFFGDLKKVLQESVWNEPPGVRFDCDGQPVTNGGGATGGGVSSKIDRPDYQNTASGFAGGLPAGEKRLIPDVALLAGPPGTAVVINEQGFITSGTSQSAPLWAGIMVLINQSKGSVQGSPNAEIYRLAAEQFKNSGPAVFTDITIGNNNTMARPPCAQTGATGFLAMLGYDLVTGWGVPNVDLLVKNFGNVPDTINPIVNVTAPTEGLILQANQQVQITWQSSDNKAIQRHNIALSTDGGTTFPVTIVENLLGNAQTFIWTVPGLTTDQARIRVTAIDGAGNNGFGVSTGNFAISNTQASFGLEVTPTQQTIIAGETSSFTINTQSIANFKSGISLSVNVQPIDAGVNAFVPENLLIPGNSAKVTITSSSNAKGDYSLTIVGTALGENQEQISKTAGVVLKVVQPDFALTFDSPQMRIDRGQKITVPLKIDRIANFTGRITITGPDSKDTSLLKLKLSPSTQITAENSVSFALKAKRSGPVGLQPLIFTGKDEQGRVRSVTLNLLIE